MNFVQFLPEKRMSIKEFLNDEPTIQKPTIRSLSNTNFMFGLHIPIAEVLTSGEFLVVTGFGMSAILFALLERFDLVSPEISTIFNLVFSTVAYGSAVFLIFKILS